MSDRCLVTGGAGFLGAHVTNELIEMGNQVVVLDDLSGGFEDNVNLKAEFVKGSITDHQLMSSLFAQHQFDYVYHLAAYAAEGLSHFIKRFNYENNLVGSINLINESIRHKIKCFVFTSSIAVYGDGELPLREENTPVPEDPYGISKLAVEWELKVTRQMFGLDYIIFRPHNVYGEYQNIGDRYRNVVGIFMNQLMQNKPLTVFGDGKQTRAFSYIGDISPIIAKSVYNKQAINEVFNIGADKDYAVLELADTVMQAMGVTSEIRHLEPRNEVRHAYSDHSKVQKVFQPYTDTSLIEGLRRMAAWARKVGARKSAHFGDIEITDNLPPVWLEN